MRFPSRFSDPHFRHFIAQLLIIIALCVISYFWIDRPLAIFMSHINGLGTTTLGNYNLTNNLTAMAYALILIVMGFYAYMRLVNHKSTRLIATTGGISFAVPIAFFVKTELQYILGRTPVRNDGSHTLLFVKHPQAYGLHLFAGGGSFPSGHMCVFTALSLMVSFYYPKLKPYMILTLGALAFILVFDNYHFLSDVIAGTYLGFIVAKITYKLET